MDEFTIDELTIPASLDVPDADDFRATVAVRNACERDGYGTDELSYSAEELLPGWQNVEHEPKRLLAARVRGEIVARGIYETQPNETESAWLQVQVHPDYRGLGIGTALSDRLEDLAAEAGKRKVIVYAVSKQGPGERLEPPTGFGSVPLGNPEVRFLLGRGYTLEQVERGSRLPLPIEERALEERLASASAASGADYRLHTWTDRTPERWREDMALLFTRMSTDAPTAGLEEPEDIWTVERLVATEEKEEQSPRTALAAAVEHVPSGRLAGFTILSVPAELDRPVSQEDTLVLREHRGKRLGMLLKVANLLHLQRERPGHPSVLTFNAEENRHMLSVNEAVGFAPMAYEGGWKKVLDAPPPDVVVPEA
ncbi:GNAT family N-acetyltransferase [Lysobacter korlensis]|uniref:GNAT family N-acetyltransferase n=1 Tax=Lysobacter korlensis TaxID=553636 RepID=A0ABV6RNS7_9GAMM